MNLKKWIVDELKTENLIHTFVCLYNLKTNFNKVKKLIYKSTKENLKIFYQNNKKKFSFVFFFVISIF